MKPHRLEWSLWQELLQVACATLEEGIRSQVVREFLRKGLLGRSEQEFHQQLNGWEDKRSDWPRIAAHDFSLLAANVAAEAVVESVELAEEIDTGRITASSPLASALSGYLAGLASAYSSFGLTSAQGLAHGLCASLSASLARGALRSPRALTASQVGRLASAFARASEFYARNPDIGLYFPFYNVAQQILIQPASALAQALPALEALTRHVAELPTVYYEEKRARAKLAALCAEIRARSR